MKYPVITTTRCVELASQRIMGTEPAVDPYVAWIGVGDPVRVQPLARAAEEMISAARSWSDPDRDRLEGKYCTVLADALTDVPAEVLDDRGFWRFLALKYFWEFIAWREEAPFAARNYLKYVDASTNTESVLPRMYLRARAVGGSTHADLAAAIPRSGDFWRSHVIRVRTGSAPPITRAFAKRQATDRLSTGPLREAAKRLNRTWTNIVLHLYDDAHAAQLLETIWDDRSTG